MSIHYILALNRQGKVRISKWFDRKISLDEQFQVRQKIHRLILSRDHKNQSNFVEFEKKKLVYRRYAGLFFCMCIDMDDGELMYLESIHLLVEVLDQYFNNVCELDLVFSFYKVYAVIDEMFMSGEIEETSKAVVLDRVDQVMAYN
ncbi:AP-2 complex subunit sigma [Komagataella phaffii]|uniref:AP complex subunit sigma n=1 Tax=Komagataella phaffii (strain GS115 / ATCC 20864) TaxID=644223 RepID=C4R6C3_KOMPG|nr:Small subunit of the clathrin-associated adaptor complex AP-2 [Komagataella phaffii GS115]AOA64184.1 GQ67_04177T0 [Komagataella phaffii]AOA69032.1 GQ68_04150T0 [Komagataella phaffii GS115]CAY71109.1 Small subunit of the clathrin-associated adaptor complex AP-2 [Komagataella phaffii GS115]